MLSLSVVIPTRDTCDLTLRCLAALQASTCAPTEVIVVDDASRDGTAAAVRQAHPTIRVVERTRPGGFSVAANDGWRLSRGALVLLLNSDAEVAPDALARIHAAFDRSPRLGIAGASLRFPDGRPQWSAGARPGRLWLFLLGSGAAAVLGRLPGYRRLRPEAQARGDVDWVPATAVTIRRDVSEMIGLFAEVYEMYAQDLEYCLRAREQGWRVAQVADAHVVHQCGGTVARTPEAVGVSAPQLVARDLCRWIQRAHAPGQARRLCAAFAAGTRLRLVARRLARPFVAPRRRGAWDADTRRYDAAFAEISLAKRYSSSSDRAISPGS